MNNKEEAENLWREKSHHLSNDEAWAYRAGISDFKAALIQSFENKYGGELLGEILKEINETKPRGRLFMI